MAHSALALSGKTLGRAEGLADLRPAPLGYRVRRIALAGLSIGALLAGLSAALLAWIGVADAGVDSGPPGGRVSFVSPTGSAWASGIRVEQVVVALHPSDSSGGWFLQSTNGTKLFTARESSANAALQRSISIGLAGALAGGLAVLFLLTRRRWALPASSLALLAASVPLQLEGGADLSTVVMGGAALLPAVAYIVRIPSDVRVRIGIVAIVAAAVIAWATARLGGFHAYTVLEPVRHDVALFGTFALVLERAILPAMTRQSLRLLRPRLFDVSAVGLFAVAALVLATALRLPLLATVVVLLVCLALVPAARRRFGRPLEEVLLADVRQQAAAEASEAERARLARELHDVPLQELAAVIRRLEILPGAEAESEDLRALAGHLRDVATDLRPPVLDDLGLPAALDYLAEEATTPAFPVTAEIIDDTGFGADRRPPSEVELAMFRIASEAVGNATRHSGGSRIEVRAAVAPDRVELLVSDDGAGLATETVRDASKRKRLGLASMRRRAEAIDAEMSIDGSPRGTTVRVMWQA